MDELYRKIAAIGRSVGAGRVVLYGSRARGDNRPHSDIDLAVFGAPAETRSAFVDALEQLPTLLDFDLVYITENTAPTLLANIQKDGVTLMDKFQEKYEKLKQAVSRLQEGIHDFERLGLDTVRDGVIQRFEFCTELAWKTLREYLLDQGYSEINSPKAVLRQAYADGILQDEKGWIDLVNARNLTSHLYDEATAQQIFEEIRTAYCPLFQQLIEKLAG